jgi:hypothetical protein
VVLEGQVLFVELHGHALANQVINELLKILKATGKPVDAVDVEFVTITQICQALRQSWPVGVLAARLILKRPVEADTRIGKLTARVLIGATDADVCDVRHDDLSVCFGLIVSR